jgi:hypothetical protein
MFNVSSISWYLSKRIMLAGKYLCELLWNLQYGQQLLATFGQAYGAVSDFGIAQLLRSKKPLGGTSGTIHR